MTHGSDARKGNTVLISIRYRPSADVLIAQVNDVVDEAVQRDTPDADTTIEWVRRPDGSRYLVGAQIMFAAARAASGGLSPALPRELDARLSAVVASHADDSRTDPFALSALDIDVPEIALELDDDLDEGRDQPATTGSRTPHSDRTDFVAEIFTAAMTTDPDADIDWPGDDVDNSGATEVNDALVALAHAIETNTADADPIPTMKLVTTLRELGSVLGRSGGRSAPGCSAAARLALRGGTPLTARERTTLAKQLDQLDDPRQWAGVTPALQSLTRHLNGDSK